jgi:hypothetical protein
MHLLFQPLALLLVAAAPTQPAAAAVALQQQVAVVQCLPLPVSAVVVAMVQCLPLPASAVMAVVQCLPLPASAVVGVPPQPAAAPVLRQLPDCHQQLALLPASVQLAAHAAPPAHAWACCCCGLPVTGA